MSRRRPELMETVNLKGLRPGAAQTLGAVRLIPLIREEVRGDLRLMDAAIPAEEARPVYFLPHGRIYGGDRGTDPAAAYGTHLSDRPEPPPRSMAIPARHQARPDEDRLGFVPMDVAMEGVITRWVHGPEIVWSAWSRRALRGEQPGGWSASPGSRIQGLDLALRRFEIHPGQAGLMVFVADALASIVALPHPEDYRRLHRSLVRDLFGSLFIQYGQLYDEAPALAPPPASAVRSIEDLWDRLGALRRHQEEAAALLASPLMGRAVSADPLYQRGPFTLQRFVTDLDTARENAIGEAILRDGGEVEVIQTFRLSGAQVRRAWLLRQLAKNHWDVAATGAALGSPPQEMARRLSNAGLDHWLHEHVLLAMRRGR